MIKLRPMTETEYGAYLPALREGYAGDRARNLHDSLESQLEAADRQIAGLLPQGLQTPNHLLWRVVTAEGEIPVGVLWVFVDSTAKKAFIYDIQIDEPYQGKGYGTATLNRLDEELQGYDVAQIGLSVFGENRGAFKLYQKLGYYIVATNMQKDLKGLSS
ncbi:MAG: GNAT family N-acetyltransferase [Ktedonobacterales bacterium]